MLPLFDQLLPQNGFWTLQFVDWTRWGCQLEWDLKLQGTTKTSFYFVTSLLKCYYACKFKTHNTHLYQAQNNSIRLKQYKALMLPSHLPRGEYVGDGWACVLCDRSI